MNLMTDPTAITTDIAYRTARDRVVRAPRTRENRIARWLRDHVTGRTTPGTTPATTSTASGAQARTLGTRRAAAHGG